MPTYEYECKKCEYRFDAFQSMSEDPLSKCPECGGRVRRLIGAGAGIIFKGSGFYSTDSRKSTSGSESKKDESTSTKKSEEVSSSGDNGSSKKSDTASSEKKTGTSSREEKSG